MSGGTRIEVSDAVVEACSRARRNALGDPTPFGVSLGQRCDWADRVAASAAINAWVVEEFTMDPRAAAARIRNLEAEITRLRSPIRQRLRRMLAAIIPKRAKKLYLIKPNEEFEESLRSTRSNSGQTNEQ